MLPLRRSDDSASRCARIRFVLGALVLGLGLCLAPPVAAYRIRASLEKEPGSPSSGPLEFSTEFDNPRPELHVSLSEGFPDNSEINGFARVRLADGSLRGDAHAVAKEQSASHELRFVVVLEEVVRITFPPGLPVAERFVTVRADVTAGAVANGRAKASGIFILQAQSLRVAVEFGSDVPAPGWNIIDDDVCVEGGVCATSSVGNGAAHFALRVFPSGGKVGIACQFEGTARAYNNPGGIADVSGGNSAHLSLELPPGATFTSTSGVFLTEQGTPSNLQRAGDGNQDGVLDLSDARLLGFLFTGATPSLPCDGGTAGAPEPGALALLDSNGDGGIDLSDAVYALAFLFLGGNEPALGQGCTPIAGCGDLCTP